MKIKSNLSFSLRKVILSALVAAPLATLPAPLWALPVTTGNVTSSSAATTYTPVSSTFLQINEPSATRLVLKWNEFGGSVTNTIGAGDTVQWNLPTGGAVLNMVSTGSTTVNGTLLSNGSIFILNQNGITLSSTATVNAAGFGISTIPEAEFSFLSSGTLGYVGTASNPAQINGATITVGTTGSVYVAGATANVSGTINGGTLNVTTQNGLVQLGATGTLDLGAAGNRGYGNLVVNSNGGAVNLAAGNTVTLRGVTHSVNTAGGVVTAPSQLSLGDGSDNTTTLNINTNGTGGVTLTNLRSTSSDRDLRLTLNSGAANIASTGGSASVGLNASTINGNLTINLSGGSIGNNGDVTVNGGVISLTSGGSNKSISFKGPGDLTFSTISGNNSTGSSVTLTSTTGSVILPGMTVGGNLTVTAQNNISQTGAIIETNGGSRTATFDSAAGSVTMTDAANDFTRVVIKRTPGGATVNDINALLLAGGTNTTGNVTLTTGGTVTLGQDSTAGVTIAGDLNITSIGAISTLGVVSGGTGYTVAPSVTLSNGGTATTTLSLTTATVAPTTAGTGYTSAPTVTLSGGGGTGAAASTTLALNAIAVGVAGSGYTATPTVTISGGGGSGATATATVDGLGNLTGFVVTAAGSGYTSVPTVTLSTVTGATAPTGIAPTASVAGIVVTNGGTGYTSSPTVALSAPPVGTQAALTTPLGGAVSAVSAITGGTSTSSVTATLSGGNAVIGVTAAGGGVVDLTNNLAVNGNLNITTPGLVKIDGATDNGVGLTHRIGAVNVNQGSSAVGVRIYENTTLNLGNITTAGVLRGLSTGGDVINTGVISATSIQLGAGTGIAPNNITLTNTGNSLGALSILDDFTVLSNAGDFTVPTEIGTLLAKDLTITSAGGFSLDKLVTTSNTGIAGNLTVTAGGLVTLGVNGAIVVGGALSVTTTGGITANNAANKISTATLTAGGAVDVNSSSAVRYNATLTGTGDALLKATGASLTIGNVSSSRSGTDTVQFQTTSDNNSITDAVNGISIFGNVRFNSSQSVTVTRAGHSFGRVQVSTGNGGSASVTEAGTLRLGSVGINGSGSFTATSTSGDILQDVSQNGVRLGNNNSTATFNATNGQVTLNDNDTTGNVNDLRRVAVNAKGDVVVNNPNGINLGNITTGGKLTVLTTSSGGAGNNIGQVSGTRLNVFDTVTLDARGTGTANITVGNTGNRLGGVVLATNTGNITITESTTLNLKSVIVGATPGFFAATSETGSIIDSADGSIASNSIAGGATGLGIATFSAPNGDVALRLTGSNFNTVGFTAGGNVTVTDAVGNIGLSASTIGGTLDVINTAAGGIIGQTAPIIANGNTTFVASTGGINLSNASNQFGALRFSVSSMGAIISEATTMNLRGGSISTGEVQLSTGGNFVTSGPGGSSFTNNLYIQAAGTIIPSVGSLLITGTFTVSSSSLKDLSALSKTGNLANKEPVNSGSGPYTGPSQ